VSPATRVPVVGSVRRRPKWGVLTSTALLLVVVLVFIVPLIFMVIVSLKTSEEQAASVFSLPAAIRLNLYTDLAGQMNYLQLIFNTLAITLVSALLTIMLASLAAYPLARLKTRWIGYTYQLFLLGLLLPGFVTLIPLYLLARDLRLLNTFHGIVLVYAGLNLPFATFFTTSFMMSIPNELEEAAAIDGCTQAQVFRYIVLPLLRPAHGTLAMFITLGIWNDLLLPLLFFSDPNRGTLTPAVYNFIGTWTTDYTVLTRAGVLASLPLLILYFSLQRQIIAGITAGAVKG
jgi:raffinose/stachyose/melibiose transport system permease protein